MARRTLGVITMLGLACLSTATAADAQAPPALAVTVNASAIAFGDPLRIGVTVDNPGGGPAADFVFALLLPDGSTLVSAGPGIGVRFGRLSDLRSVVPVVRGVPLAGAFRFQEPSFFNYTFTGIEPQGTYRILFAAFTAGALDDGVIGAGELLALASRDVTVSAAPPLTTEDPTRRVTAVVPRSGGTVQTTNAAGATLTLTVPANAVPADTTISITPLTAFQNLPLGPLVSGVSLEPSGLTFATPATLTITLPPGYAVPEPGLAGFIANSAGRNLQAVPASVAGGAVTLAVAHFSTAGIALATAQFDVACAATQAARNPQQATACARLRPLFAIEATRLATAGGRYDPTFVVNVLTELSLWMSGGLQARLGAAAVPDPADAMRFVREVGDEWLDWLAVFDMLFRVSDRTNEIRLGSNGLLGSVARQIDQAQAAYNNVLLAAMNATNTRCLADKPHVDSYVTDVILIKEFWGFQFDDPDPPLPFGVQFCVDIRIDAAPPPVLTPGVAALMPIDLRIRFIDGVELPGPPLVVTITSTNGTVSPAGGTLPTPITSPPVTPTLTPTATSASVTITAAFGATPTFPSFAGLPVRSRSFQAGQSLPITISNGEVEAEVRLAQNGLGLRFGDSDNDVALPNANVNVTAPLRSFGDFSAEATVSATRQISVTSSGITATMVGSIGLNLQSHVAGPDVVDLVGDVGDTWTVTLPVAFDVQGVLANGGTLSVGGVNVSSGARVRVGAGDHQISFSRQLIRTLQNGTFTGPTSATPGYTLTFTPAP